MSELEECRPGPCWPGSEPPSTAKITSEVLSEYSKNHQNNNNSNNKVYETNGKKIKYILEATTTKTHWWGRSLVQQLTKPLRCLDLTPVSGFKSQLHPQPELPSRYTLSALVPAISGGDPSWALGSQLQPGPERAVADTYGINQHVKYLFLCVCVCMRVQKQMHFSTFSFLLKILNS